VMYILRSAIYTLKEDERCKAYEEYGREKKFVQSFDQKI
jgi:hypothetical protein